jgi:hypothetical protein
MGRIERSGGVGFGKFMPLLKLNTCFGGFVEIVYRLEYG